jgi:hypothetical protein
MNFLCSNFGGNSCIAHVASCKKECLSKLLAYDFSPDGLPVGLGGSWTGGCEPWRGRKQPYPPTAAAATTPATTASSNSNNNDDDLSLEIETDLTCLLRNSLWLHNIAMADDQNAQQALLGADPSTAAIPQNTDLVLVPDKEQVPNNNSNNKKRKTVAHALESDVSHNLNSRVEIRPVAGSIITTVPERRQNIPVATLPERKPPTGGDQPSKTTRPSKVPVKKLDRTAVDSPPIPPKLSVASAIANAAAPPAPGDARRSPPLPSTTTTTTRVLPRAEQPEDERDFRRKRDAIYSKRKRERKRIEIEELHKQQLHLGALNDVLRAESERLEQMLRAAQKESP